MYLIFQQVALTAQPISATSICRGL